MLSLGQTWRVTTGALPAAQAGLRKGQLGAVRDHLRLVPCTRVRVDFFIQNRVLATILLLRLGSPSSPAPEPVCACGGCSLHRWESKATLQLDLAAAGVQPSNRPTLSPVVLMPSLKIASYGFIGCLFSELCELPGARWGVH